MNLTSSSCLLDLARVASKALPAYFEHASHKKTDKMMAEYSPASSADTFKALDVQKS